MTRHRVVFGNRQVPLPRSKGLRIALGSALLLGGLVGFLPVLGFWMIPLGLIVLSIDIAVARRLRRRSVVWWGRRRGARRERT
ncbi:hypothetical protein [Microvirga sp. M2]|uniref:hypothetical protein n=1 Tax=Microvirga sp. M2 TaxID=3073270 RepID=UPI0039C09F05